MQDEHTDLADFTEFLRKKTYILANAFEQDKKFLPLPNVLKSNKGTPNPQQIEAPIQQDLIEKEVENVTKKDYRLLKNNNYEVFLAPYQEIPNIMKEIGRLREITFREVGEGTNASSDVDKFDLYYHHLFLWDNEAKKNCRSLSYGIRR